MRGARPESTLTKRFAEITAVSSGDHVLVALSGGCDSVALLALATEFAATHGAHVHAVHVHHGTRESADQDCIVAAAAALRLGVGFSVERLRPQGVDEAQLRRLRYAALLAVAVRRSATHVLTGHNAQDQTETVLLALFRGTGRAGLQGMPVRRPLNAEITLERPLLRCDRQELQRYCARLGLAYVLDPTNADAGYRRNALRRLLAEARPSFPGLDAAVARCAATLRAEPSDVPTATELLRDWFAEQQLPQAVTAERIESIVRYLDIGQGRRLRLSLEAHPTKASSSCTKGEVTATHDDDEAHE